MKEGIVALLGRICLSVIFLTSANSKIFGWEGNVAYFATRHITNPLLVSLMLGGAAAIELVGALCLLSGFQARIAAFVMALYLAAVNVIFHNFWALPEAARGANLTHFQKNLAIIGGLLIVAALGPGRFALGRKSRSAAS
ncbi:MAG: DoxX family protein [Chthoniobacterales bacterium]